MAKFYSKVKGALWREQWNIGVSSFLQSDFPAWNVERSQVQWLFPEKKDGYYADPFLVSHEGKTFLFFEEFEDATQRGFISYSILQNVGGKIIASAPRRALSKPFHLSYPFLFKDNDSLLMVPEASQANEVAFYKPAHFPDVWVKAKTIVPNFPGVDPSIVFWKGKYWLFCTHLKNGRSSELHIFFSEELYGEWKAHKKNPVKISYSNTRPAGAFFEKDGRLFRPAQDCSKTYGGAMVFNEIMELNENTFSEKTIKKIDPNFSPVYDKGIHTFNSLGDLAVFDGKRFCFIKKHLNRHWQKSKKIFSSFNKNDKK